jgi:hypothetical protein
MANPDFFIIGAPKCGTTSWSEYLAKHNQIQRSSQSEPHYFSSDFAGYQVTAELAEYLGYFSASREVVTRFDCSPLYLYSNEALERIHEFNPDARVLVLLREQSQFLPSWHNQLLYSLNENIRDFGEAWRRSGHRTEADIPPTCRSIRVLDYRAMGNFAPRVEHCLRVFGPERLRVAWMDDWRPNPAAFHAYLMRFLGVREDTPTEFSNANPAHRNRSALIGRIAHRPPEWLTKSVAASKRALGIKSFGVGAMMLRMNRAQGYSSEIPGGLAVEISNCYAAENLELREKLKTVGCLYVPPRAA